MEGNDALPNDPSWHQLATSWEVITKNSTTRRFALPFELPRSIQKYPTRAHSAGKSKVSSDIPVDYDILYPPSATDLQMRVVDEAVTLGETLGLETMNPANAVTQKLPTSVDQLRSPALPFSTPEKFDGTRAKFENFATDMQIRFRSNPLMFSTEESKIMYAGSYLTGSAYSWFKPHINSLTGAITLTSYAVFMMSLGAALDDPDAYATVERELGLIRQEGSCATYCAQIVSIFSRLGWEE